jgi:uncharacterized protein YjbJ (UPF0337 family)
MADDLKGKARHVGGKVKEKAGDLLGDTKLRRDGKLEQFEGEAEQDQARAEKDVEEAAERRYAAREARKRPTK